MAVFGKRVLPKKLVAAALLLEVAGVLVVGFGLTRSARDAVAPVVSASAGDDRARAWWYYTAGGPVVVRAEPRADSVALGCLGSGVVLEGGQLGEVNGWRQVKAYGWTGWLRAGVLSAGWHAGALGGSMAVLGDCSA